MTCKEEYIKRLELGASNNIDYTDKLVKVVGVHTVGCEVIGVVVDLYNANGQFTGTDTITNKSKCHSDMHKVLGVLIEGTIQGRGTDCNGVLRSCVFTDFYLCNMLLNSKFNSLAIVSCNQ